MAKKEYTSEEIKNRLSDIGEAIGNIALDYIIKLERENAELEKAYNETEELLDKQIEETYKLFKENTELKEQNLKNCKAFNKVMKEQWKEEHNQLTMAKELLRFWVNDFYDGFNNSIRYEQRHEALVKTEQFLK